MSEVKLVLEATGSDIFNFALAGLCYVMALSLIHLMTLWTGLADLEATRWRLDRG